MNPYMKEIDLKIKSTIQGERPKGDRVPEGQYKLQGWPIILNDDFTHHGIII